MKRLLLLLPLALLVSCKCQKSDTATLTPNGHWTLEYVTAPAADFDALYPAEKPTLSIDLKENRVSGKNGCNSYSGPVTVIDKTIAFSPNMMSTKMYCPGEGEKTFMDALQKTNRFDLSKDGKLTLLTGDVTVMRFSPK